jgi:hypothetical protein
MRAGAQTESGGVGSAMGGHSLGCARFDVPEMMGLCRIAGLAIYRRWDRMRKTTSRQLQHCADCLDQQEIDSMRRPAKLGILDD